MPSAPSTPTGFHGLLPYPPPSPPFPPCITSHKTEVSHALPPFTSSFYSHLFRFSHYVRTSSPYYPTNLQKPIGPFPLPCIYREMVIQLHLAPYVFSPLKRTLPSLCLLGPIGSLFQKLISSHIRSVIFFYFQKEQ